ncbi:hypothetical protein [Xanthomonas hortorum]|uniref:hypothetical protein n=1 Tax=Xanthomonas hortorum TaxID=56454 RepID=UPI000A7633C1|nr:hypothetical protein [Xanthomonas hortorum]
METRSCIGQDGTKREFEFHYRKNEDRVFVFVHDHYHDPIFELNLDLENQARVIVMSHGSNYDYARFGIAEQALAFAAKAIGRPVYSNNSADSEVNRREDVATKVWKRLVALGGADYDPEDDRYHTV